MAYEGTLRGIGALLVADQRFEGLHYDIEVKVQPDWSKSAVVRLWGNEEAFQYVAGGAAVLELQDGYTVKLSSINRAM